MKKVLIIEAQMKQYRVPFYLLLKNVLAANAIELKVAYSDPPPCEVSRNDTCDLPSSVGLKVHGYWLWPNRLLYQPLLATALFSDLVIVDQGNRFLLNLLLLPLARVGARKIAFWGLGDNRQAGRIAFSEWHRLKTLNWASWWFAYTKGTARYLEQQGVLSSRITAVQNSVDTQSIKECVKNLTTDMRFAIRQRLGIPRFAPTGIYCGMLDKVKSLPFLVEASRIVKGRLPNFHLIVVGGGPEQKAIESLVRDQPWIHLLGPRFDKEKAEFMAISDALLAPGRVGLVVLDAFAAGLPVITTRLPIHGPEFEYLEEGCNGVTTEPQEEAFAEVMIRVFCEPDRLQQLKEGARASAEKYSIEVMVENFRDGIRQCLDRPRWQSSNSKLSEEQVFRGQ